MELDYTAQGSKPTVQQIIAGWRKAGKPASFTVEYGETFARFKLYLGKWVASGNGCDGVKRDTVVKALQADEDKGNTAR